MREFLAMTVGITLMLISQVGCSLQSPIAPLSGQGSFAVNTPDLYTENRVFYLYEFDAPRVSMESTYSAIGDEQQHAAALAHTHEILQACDRSTATPAQMAAAGAAPTEPGTGVRPIEPDSIQDGDPLSVIVSGVRIPEDLSGRRDIAVILDIATTADSTTQPIVVFYQRDVPGGQMLNFQNLLVYYDPHWDSTVPPYFRLRIIDVRSERSGRTRELLDRSANLGAAISGLFPHPIIPIVTTASEAAKLLLANPENRILLDYSVQFYYTNNKSRIPLSPLRAGEWLVLGRPSKRVLSENAYSLLDGGESPAEFWRQPLYLDRRSGQIRVLSTQKPVPCPYISVIVANQDAQIPKVVMDRSADLFRIVSSQAGKTDSTQLTSKLQTLNSAIQSFSLQRQVVQYGDGEALKDLIIAATAKQAESTALSRGDQQEAVRFIKSLMSSSTQRQVEGMGGLDKWWSQEADSWRLVRSNLLETQARGRYGWTLTKVDSRGAPIKEEKSR
jgi:hypothetical protein